MLCRAGLASVVPIVKYQPRAFVASLRVGLLESCLQMDQ